MRKRVSIKQGQPMKKVFLKHISTLTFLNKIILFYLVFIFLNLKSHAQETEKRRDVDVVIAMDLSGSTNGLLENFRDKMWDIINQWKLFKPVPSLRIGIVGFSRLSFSSQNGYVKIICDLTDDYDVVSNELNSIKPYVENGYQFVGSAMEVCIESLNWSKDDDALKMVFIMHKFEEVK